ncbi:MAG: hypothetical protein WAP03_16510 [Methylorubrum rhodinum]|uniref:hypothetical protein n=1 Tax=Methylorubrum rhodinum TaxID=29428 RepID=UPI003BAE99E4
MSAEFEAELRSAFPRETDAVVIRSVQQAIGLADTLRSDTPFLKSVLGEDLIGCLHRVAALWLLHKACKDGDLPFNAEEIENKTGTSHLLKITSGRFEAHVVRTESPGGFPRDMPVRQDASFKNEPDLFSDIKLVPAKLLLEKMSTRYAWLSFNTVNKGVLGHVCWCMPEKEERKYLARINILREMRDRGDNADDLAPNKPPPKPDPKLLLKFKDHVQEQIERNDDTEEKKSAS